MYLFVTLNKANEQYKEYKLKGISGFSFTLEHYFSFYLSILFDLIFYFFLQQLNHDGKKKCEESNHNLFRFTFFTVDEKVIS